MESLLPLAWLFSWCVGAVALAMVVMFVVTQRWAEAIATTFPLGMFAGLCWIIWIEMERAPV